MHTLKAKIIVQNNYLKFYNVIVSLLNFQFVSNLYIDLINIRLLKTVLFINLKCINKKVN